MFSFDFQLDEEFQFLQKVVDGGHVVVLADGADMEIVVSNCQVQVV